jgi:hypothetical protein
MNPVTAGLEDGTIGFTGVSKKIGVCYAGVTCRF